MEEKEGMETVVKQAAQKQKIIEDYEMKMKSLENDLQARELLIERLQKKAVPTLKTQANREFEAGEMSFSESEADVS
jgi:hypothetical protein